MKTTWSAGRPSCAAAAVKSASRSASAVSPDRSLTMPRTVRAGKEACSEAAAAATRVGEDELITTSAPAERAASATPVADAGAAADEEDVLAGELVVFGGHCGRRVVVKLQE